MPGQRLRHARMRLLGGVGLAVLLGVAFWPPAPAPGQGTGGATGQGSGQSTGQSTGQSGAPRPGLTFGPASGEVERRVLVVSRRRVLEDSRAARAIAQAERQLAERLQADIDAKKAGLAAEEEELARLRDTLEREEFEARADAFRARVQTERRLAQQRSAALQTVFRNVRRRLVEALGPILSTLRAQRGADVILNADAVLVADPLADVTGDVLAAFDARVPPPQIELPEILRSALEGEPGSTPAQASLPEPDLDLDFDAGPGPEDAAIPSLPLRLLPEPSGQDAAPAEGAVDRP